MKSAGSGFRSSTMSFAPPSDKFHTTQEALKASSSVRIAAHPFQDFRSLCLLTRCSMPTAIHLEPRLGLRLLERRLDSCEVRIQA
jgi:hypothetical protein